MTTACSLCASTDGPFLQEPTGLRKSPYFYKCQKCSVDNKYTTFKDTVGMNPSKASISEYFYICPGCANLYYMAIPYANLRYDVKVCPSCGTQFPSEEDIAYTAEHQAYKVALKGRPYNLPEEAFEPLYDKLLEVLPKLSKAIDDFLLVETKKGKDIWAITKGNDSQMEKALQWVLMKAVDRKMSFSSSQRYDFAIKGVKILKQSKQ